MTTLNDEHLCRALIPAIERLYESDLSEEKMAHQVGIPNIEHARDMSIELAERGGITRNLLKRIVFPNTGVPDDEDEIIAGVRRFLEENPEVDV